MAEEITFQIVRWIIYIGIGIWVASTQVKVRKVQVFWAYFLCLAISPLWGWALIALFTDRKEKL